MRRSRLPELERLAGTIEAWGPEVLGFLQTGITNADTEAANRTDETAARTTYGFRNLDNQRRRVRSPAPSQIAGHLLTGHFPLKFE